MKLLRPGLVRNISTIALSTLVTQGAMLAIMPVLTRLYPPEAFGMFATFSALHAVTAIVFSLKYDMAIIVPKDDGDARNPLMLAMVVPVLLSACLLVGLLIAGTLGRIHWYLLLLPLSISTASIYNAFQQWGARQRDYHHYAVSQIVNTGFNLAICLVVGLVLPGFSEGLVLGVTGGFLAGAAYMLWVSRKVFDRQRFGVALPAVSRVWNAARQFSHMPMQVLPFTILVVIGQNATPLLLGTRYPLAEIGLLAVASRVLLAPSAILGVAIGEPFRAELAARVRNGQDLASITRRTIGILVVLALIAFATMYAIAPVFFAMLFGKAFAPSGEIARALCAGAFAQFIVLPVTFTFVVTGHLRAGLIAQAITALAPAGVLYAVSAREPMVTSLQVWSIAMLVAGMVFIALVYRAVLSPRPHEDSMRAET